MTAQPPMRAETMSGPAGTGRWFRLGAVPNSTVPQPAALRLFCFPYAGGAANAFAPLSAALRPGIEVIALQYPGRQDRANEAPIEDICVIAEQIADQFGPWTAEPFAFFGHSMGAMVAFETARLLPVPPMALFASARKAPCAGPGPVRDTSDDALIRELTRLCGTDAAILADPELLEVILPVIRADFRAVQAYRYRPGAKLSCPVVAMLGCSDPLVSAEEAARWAEHTTAGCSVHVFEGDHFYLVPRLPQLAELISRYLAQPVTR